MHLPARLVLTLLLASPAGASAQIGFGAHLGTTGFGGEVAVALGGNAQVRGTAGIMPIEPSFARLSETIDLTAELPNSFLMAGIDFFPSGSGFRIGGGILLMPDDPILTGELSRPTRVGYQTYTPDQVGTLTGAVESTEIAPYLMIGFGKHASAGIGLFVDLGAAFVGESTVYLASRGGTLSGNPHLQVELAREEAEWQERIDELEIYPILNLGLRVGIGN